jgi:hypothetical protein
MAKRANGDGSAYKRMKDGRLLRWEGVITDADTGNVRRVPTFLSRMSVADFPTARSLQAGRPASIAATWALPAASAKSCGTGLRSPGALPNISTATVFSTVNTSAAIALLPSVDVPLVNIASGETEGTGTGVPVTWEVTLFAAPPSDVAACAASSVMMIDALMALVPDE